MSHDIDWAQVLTGTQVFANGYAWIVEAHVGNRIDLYSPVLDKRHQGSPKPWNKVTVLTADDPRYLKDWREKFIEVLATEEDLHGQQIAELLLTVKLGAHTLGERIDEPDTWTHWRTNVFDRMTVTERRLHVVYFHRIDVAEIADGDLHFYHGRDHEIEDAGRIEAHLHRSKR